MTEPPTSRWGTGFEGGDGQFVDLNGNEIPEIYEGRPDNDGRLDAHDPHDLDGDGLDDGSSRRDMDANGTADTSDRFVDTDADLVSDHSVTRLMAELMLFDRSRDEVRLGVTSIRPAHGRLAAAMEHNRGDFDAHGTALRDWPPTRGWQHL